VTTISLVEAPISHKNPNIPTATHMYHKV
jgi:hypothetical protein